LKNLAISSDKEENDWNEDLVEQKSHHSDDDSKENDTDRNPEVILDIPMDKDVLKLSIKAMDKLIDFFNPSKSILANESNPIYQFKKSESPLSIQIIPNVNRIRLEKARAVSAIQERKCSLQELIEECKQLRKNEEIYSAEEIEPISYYRENIFNLEDYYLYRGVMKFYFKDFGGAIEDYIIWNKIKSTSKGNQLDKSSHVSSKTDLSDIGLWSFNTYEINFNILLCYLSSGDITNALRYASKLIDSVPSKYKSKLYLIRGLLYQENEDFTRWKKDFMKSYTNDPQLSTQWLDLEKECLIEPFSVKQRLWAKFPHVKLKIGSTMIYSRPSFSIPFIKPPNMIPNVDEEQMQKELTLSHLGGIKPEAPWIKRCGFGIKFTDEIQDTDFKIEPDSVAKPKELFESPPPVQKKQNKYEESPIYEKRVLSEQILRKNDYTIDDGFIHNDHIYAQKEFEQELEPHKVSIIEDSII
jgi:tetratricopeptide (TPR) repeat protein